MRHAASSLRWGLPFFLSVSMLAALASAQVQRAAPRGRLPPYYKDLVSTDQRDEIYRIQARFNAKIDELEAEIEKLKAERDAEVEKVLSPQQRARLKLLLAEKGKLNSKEADQQAGQENAKEGPAKKSVFPK